MIVLKARVLGLEAGEPIVILNREDAEEIDVKPLDRVELVLKDRRRTAIVNLAEHFVKPGEIGLYSRIAEKLEAKDGDKVKTIPAGPPESLVYIRNKLEGNVLKDREIERIVKDVVHRRLSEIEITAFVTALYNHGMSNHEVSALSKSMAATGKTLNLGKKEIYDKHSVGGCPGDKTSMLLVPIVASAGLTIPKTSSRAITSPAGTADRFECIAPVDLEMEEIKEVVRKTNACLVWGGSVDLAPADDLFIKVEYPLSIDPLLLPSVMSKKKAVGAKYLVIDIPTGKGTKIRTTKEAETLAEKFIELGKRLGIKTIGASTFGEQPIGYGIGPALEAKEALETLMNGKGPEDLVDKVTHLAGILLGFKSNRVANKQALQLLKSGKAYKKLKEIIEAQGGDPKIRPDDIQIGTRRAEVKSNIDGKVWWINNRAVVELSRAAGTPKDRGAGMLLHKKTGDAVRKNDTLFEIYADKGYKLERALKLAEDLHVMGVERKVGMLLEKIPTTIEHPKYFILER